MSQAIHSVLLLHITSPPTQPHLPLLKSIQKVLNESYTKTYCAHPELFGTEHLRLADPAQLKDTVGEDGFTIALVRAKAQGPTSNGKTAVELVATGSVKNFGDGNVETYAQRSKNLSGSEWVAKEEGGHARSQVQAEKSGDGASRYEVTAFAVAPDAQAAGLGARVLQDIEWLVSRNLDSLSAGTEDLPEVDGLELVELEQGSDVKGVDLDKLKNKGTINGTKDSGAENLHATKPKLVLIGIKELGNEAYYQQRGFKSVWSGTLPVGMWDCRKECTMVYMEKEIT